MIRTTAINKRVITCTRRFVPSGLSPAPAPAGRVDLNPRPRRTVEQRITPGCMIAVKPHQWEPQEYSGAAAGARGQTRIFLTGRELLDQASDQKGGVV
jgi:hypothetical protein